MAELNIPAANVTSLFEVFAPAGVSPVLIGKYNLEINRVLALPEFRARQMATDNVPTGGSADRFGEAISSEYESNARIVKAAGIKAD